MERFAELEAAGGVACDPGVVAGGDLLCADGARLLMKEVELHMRVAEHARARRQAAQVRLHERRDHLLVKVLLEVQREGRGLHLPGPPAGGGEGLHRAATAAV